MSNNIARFITNLGNPFLVVIPITHLIIFFFNYSDFKNLSASIIFQVILPALILIVSIKLKFIQDYEISNRKERKGYFIALTILFLITVLITKDSAHFLSVFNLSLFFGISSIMLISSFWKISRHMILDMICFATLIIISPILLFLLPFCIAVGYTRVLLQKHTLNQVILGSLLGLLIFIVTYNLVKL